MARVSDQNGVSLLPVYIMLEIHHSGWELSMCKNLSNNDESQGSSCEHRRGEETKHSLQTNRPLTIVDLVPSLANSFEVAVNFILSTVHTVHQGLTLLLQFVHGMRFLLQVCFHSLLTKKKKKKKSLNVSRFDEAHTNTDRN